MGGSVPKEAIRDCRGADSWARLSPTCRHVRDFGILISVPDRLKEKTARDYKELLRAGKWFKGLADDFQDALLAAANVRNYKSGETVFTRGDACLGLCGTLEGSIRVGGSTEEGEETVLVFAEPPTWFGEISIVDDGPMTHDAIADRESLLVHVPPPALAALLKAKPERWRDIARLMAMKVRLLFTGMEELALLPTSMLLARRLVHMTEGYGGWDDRSARVLQVSQEQLATMLGVSRQTVNQVLKELEAKKLVRPSYGGIEILDLAGLRREAGRMLMP
jgi:CRP-like cAMP-binding protein